MLGAWSSRQQNFVQWCVKFMGPQCRIYCHRPRWIFGFHTSGTIFFLTVNTKSTDESATIITSTLYCWSNFTYVST